MSELKEQSWAVISHRGVEATGLTYDEALDLRRQLSAEGVHGLCIVSAQAAAREEPEPQSASSP